MTTPRITHLALCTLLALPMISPPASATADAPTTTKAFARCTRVLASRLRVRVVDGHYEAQYSEALQRLVSPKRMELTARSVRTHRVVARAACTYTSGGRVVGFTLLSSGPPTPLN
jgi:hypothetical protein